MVFSSPIFLFGFLPIVLALYYFSPRRLKNTLLLIASLAFYAWGEIFYVAVMLASITINYIIGKSIDTALRDQKSLLSSKQYLIIGITANIAMLGFFKYANFFVDNLNIVLTSMDVRPLQLTPIHLPLGISFFTFQAISYIVDVYKKETEAQKSFNNLALYISSFPQLIAGPIVRYHDVAKQIVQRRHSLELFSSGVERFIIGLAKKMLIANPLGEVADNIFALSTNDLTMPLAWLGVLCYSLQIYFDFSGYSDMAIGLGRMFGFQFNENFNHPYIARSIREFWRRWHISLSGWFRDYVYIPLGGNRVGTLRVYINLLIVFLLTGFWHGASWNFIAWGLFHGFFLALEHAGFSSILDKLYSPLRHLYLLLIVLLSWVMFRAETLSEAISYYSIMLDFNRWETTTLQFMQVRSEEFFYALTAGLILSMPVYTIAGRYIARITQSSHAVTGVIHDTLKTLMLFTLLYLSILKIASSTYNPFIYFRF